MRIRRSTLALACLLAFVLAAAEARPSKQLIRVKRFSTDKTRRSVVQEAKDVEPSSVVSRSEGDEKATESREQGTAEEAEEKKEENENSVSQNIGDNDNSDKDYDDRDKDDDDDCDKHDDDNEDHDNHDDDKAFDDSLLSHLASKSEYDGGSKRLTIDPLYDPEADDVDDDEAEGKAETFWDYIMDMFNLEPDWQEKLQDEINNGYYSTHEDEEGYPIEDYEDGDGYGYSLEEADTAANEDHSAQVSVEVESRSSD